MTLYTNYTAAQASTRAKQYTRWQTNMCLNFARNMLHGSSSISTASMPLPDAKSAYYAAKQRVTTGNPPAGAPVYWRTRSHPYWHIAVSVGGGYVRTTDWDTNLGYVKGHVGTVSISRLTSAWGMVYLGWSRDLAGRVIRGLEAKATTIPSTIPAPPNYSETTSYVVNDEALRLGVRSTTAALFNGRLWSWLYWHGGTAGRSFCVNNYKAWMAEPSNLFGTTSIKAMQQMYRILASRETSGGWTPTATWPGRALLVRLGLRGD